LRIANIAGLEDNVRILQRNKRNIIFVNGENMLEKEKLITAKSDEAFANCTYPGDDE
jgi:hypothetical protein